MARANAGPPKEPRGSVSRRDGAPPDRDGVTPLRPQRPAPAPDDARRSELAEELRGINRFADDHALGRASDPVRRLVHDAFSDLDSFATAVRNETVPVPVLGGDPATAPSPAPPSQAIPADAQAPAAPAHSPEADLSAPSGESEQPSPPPASAPFPRPRPAPSAPSIYPTSDPRILYLPVGVVRPRPIAPRPLTLPGKLRPEGAHDVAAVRAEPPPPPPPLVHPRPISDPVLPTAARRPEPVAPPAAQAPAVPPPAPPHPAAPMNGTSVTYTVHAQRPTVARPAPPTESTETSSPHVEHPTPQTAAVLAPASSVPERPVQVADEPVESVRTYLTNIGLAAVLCFVVVMFAVVVYARFTHHNAEQVVTGSMTPRIPIGSLVISEAVPTTSLKPGDVIMFPKPFVAGQTVVHRIVDMTRTGDGNVEIHTKGDANRAPDGWTLDRSATDSADRVIYVVPVMGTVAYWALRLGVIALIIIIGISVFLYLLRIIWTDAMPPRDNGHGDDDTGDSVAAGAADNRRDDPVAARASP